MHQYVGQESACCCVAIRNCSVSNKLFRLSVSKLRFQNSVASVNLWLMVASLLTALIDKIRAVWVNSLTLNDPHRCRTAPLTSEVAFYIFIQKTHVLNILSMIYILRFFSSKCSLFHNSKVFGPCIIHILYTGVLKLKKNNSGAKRLTDSCHNFVNVLRNVLKLGIYRC